MMRIEAVEQPLMAFLLDELLQPQRMAQAVESYNWKLEERARADAPARRLAVVEQRIAQLEQEQARLVAAIAKGVAYDAIAAALAATEQQLKKARAERAALAAPRELGLLPRWSLGDLAARLRQFRDDFRKLDPDRLREVLARIFGRIVVRPLKGAWSIGWELEMKTRPWAVLLPTVASSSGCGGAISPTPQSRLGLALASEVTPVRGVSDRTKLLRRVEEPRVVSVG